MKERRKQDVDIKGYGGLEQGIYHIYISLYLDIPSFYLPLYLILIVNIWNIQVLLQFLNQKTSNLSLEQIQQVKEDRWTRY